MKITRIQATFRVKKMFDLQNHVNEFENALGKYFKTPFNMAKISDSAPDEFPRFIGQPREGFGIRASAVEVAVEWQNIPSSFDDAFVLDKLGDIVSDVGSFLENYIDAPYNYFGLQVFMRVEESVIGIEPSLYMIKLAPGTKTGDVIDHIEVRNSYVEPPYFINNSISNAVPIQINGDKYSKPQSIIKGKEFLSVMFDVNDKYAFFHMPNYESVVESAEGIVDKFIAFYNEKLLDYLKGNEINHFLN